MIWFVEIGWFFLLVLIYDFKIFFKLFFWKCLIMFLILFWDCNSIWINWIVIDWLLLLLFKIDDVIEFKILFSIKIFLKEMFFKMRVF